MKRKKNERRARRTITRRNVRRPEDTNETIEQLEAKLATAGAPVLPSKPEAIVGLSRKAIKVAEQVFQWRIPKRNQIPSDDHILTLARAIQRGEAMPPILVFPVGREYYVMDGHHRLAAHDNAGWSKAITAQVFTGSLREAERAALRANNKDKLALTRDDRTAAAWRLVRQCDPRDSIKSTMADSGASKGTVDTMRAVLKKLQALGKSPEDIKDMPWWRARSLGAEDNPEWQEQEDRVEVEADKLADEILHCKLGARFIRDTEVTARALEKLDEDLPPRPYGGVGTGTRV